VKYCRLNIMDKVRENKPIIKLPRPWIECHLYEEEKNYNKKKIPIRY